VIAQIVAWLCSLLAAFMLIRSAGERISPDTRLTIDANSYTKGARAMIASGDFFIAPDTYHSVGMQVLLSWVLRLSDSLLTFRYFNLVVLVAIAFGSHLLFSRVLESKSWAALASIWLAACASLPKFASLIQYEIVLCLALLCLSLALLQPAVGKMLASAGGVILFFAVSIRPHFLAWLFIAALTKKTRSFAFRLLPALAVLTLSWNAAYSLKLEKPFFFWNLSRPFPIYKSLSERSFGMTYPPSPTTTHGGLRFIVERPGAYWKLLGRRFLYATSLSPDSWNVRSWPEQLLKHFRLNPGWLGKILAFSGTVLTAIGIFCFPKEWKVAIAGPIGCVVIVFFILNASFRYFIPMLPQIICAQAYGLKRLVEWRSGKTAWIFRS
jgi:hypothetical protein